jgi:hypothetical protein
MRPRHPRVAGATLVALLTATMLAACGSSSGNGVASKTPTEIVTAAKTAVDGANAVHVSGSIVSSGTPITLDLDLLAGKGARGRLSDNGLAFELIEIGQTVYIKGSSAFYRHLGGTAAAQLLEGKWLKAPTTSGSFASLASLTDLRQLFDTAFAHHGTLAKSGTTTIGGQKVVGVSDTSKGGTLYVATTGSAYPIQVVGAATNVGKISFDRWNERVPLAQPANAIDITQLQSGH